MSEAKKRLYDALRACQPKPASMPAPGSQWEAWAEYRFEQLENYQTWIIRLLVGSLAVQVGLKLIDIIR